MSQMGKISRRTVLASAFGCAAATAARAGRRTPFKIGVPDWSMDLGANPDAVPLAKKIGFDGVQISFGRLPINGKLPLDNPDLIAKYLQLSAQNGIPIDGTCVDRLHMDVLKSDKAAVRWVSDGIRLTKALNTQVLLLPFFGRGALKTRAEMDYVADVLRDLGAEAQKAGVILGLEDTVSAIDNVAIMERSKSSAVKVYYDVGNSNEAGFDPISEIRWLGRERICQIHLKDTGEWLGEGVIRYPPLIRAIQDIHYTGYANIEMDSKPGQVEFDMKKNLAYVRNLENA
jgi:sugar phosphate isomerase/epimerase